MIFRFSTPLCISIADHLFLGRKLPSGRSWLCLLALLVGAVERGAVAPHGIIGQSYQDHRVRNGKLDETRKQDRTARDDSRQASRQPEPPPAM